MKMVKIGKKKIPVVEVKTIAVFSAGRMGKSEAGVYHFWAAVCIDGKKTTAVFGRALNKLDAGERFRRIGLETKIAATASDRKEYSKLWKKLSGVVYVRPATVMEVTRWISSHEEDSIHIKSLKFS